MKPILTLLALLLIIGCKKSDDASSQSINSSTSSTASFSVRVNGVLSTYDSAIAYLLLDTQFFITVRKLRIDGDFPDKQVTPGFEDQTATTVLSTLNYNKATGARMQYYQWNDSVNGFICAAANFSLTSVDTANKKISGNFSATVVGNVTGDTVQITNGIFSNIHYEVQ